MDNLIAAVAALVIGLLAGLALLLGLRRGARTAPALAELTGRLSQLADSQAAQQAALAAQMQAQERALAKSLEERLADFGTRVGGRLQEQTVLSTQSMSELKERLAVIDAAQKNITELSSQVVDLQNLLSNKQAQGAFGQIQMEDLVRDMLPPTAYSFQATLRDGRRVDCLLNLPNPPGPIGLDAKFPLDSYRALREARDETARIQAQRAFDAAVRRHARDIAERYIVAGETAESALMFLPSEAIYAELHANFKAVVEESFRRRVWIVSPTTLMALLTTVRAVFRDVQMREQAGRIQSEVRAILDDVTRLDERVEKLQRHFGQVVADVQQVRISTTKIADRARNIDAVRLEAEPAAGELAAERPSASPGTEN